MAKRDLWTIASVTLGVFVLANIGAMVWGTKLPVSLKLDEIEAAHNPNVLLVGNSLLDAHIDAKAFEEAARTQSVEMIPVNAALAATQAPEQYLLFKQGLRHRGIKTVVVGFFDWQLTKRDEPRVSYLFGYRAVGFDSRVRARDAEFVYDFDITERLKFRLFRLIPLFSYRSAVWESVERFRRSLGKREWPLDNDDRSVIDLFTEQNGEIARNHLNRPMESLVSESAARNARVVFVLMPISPRHRANYYSRAAWHSYQEKLQRWMFAHQCGWIDASEWLVDKNDFADSLHFKWTKNAAFSVMLANALAREQKSLRIPRSVLLQNVNQR